MQCSDLTAPQKAKTFNKKPAVKDVAPKAIKGKTFQDSQKAQFWKQTQQNYSGIFIGKFWKQTLIIQKINISFSKFRA